MRFLLKGTSGAIALTFLWAAPVWAKPVAPVAFCDSYPDSPSCIAGTPACTFCHTGAPPERNPFGQALEAELLPAAPRPLSDADFLGALPTALQAVESADADGDGYTNFDEITAGTLPGDVASLPDNPACPQGVNPRWNLCGFDPAYAFKKIHLDFCGRSPTYQDLEAFRAESDQMAALDRTLDFCLDTEFWMGKNGQLWQIAHKKIRPLQAIKAGEDGGPIPLGDYYDDYALFAYAHSDDHDVRDVLVADYFVTRRTNPTRYEIASPSDQVGEQSVVPERRAGLMTTRWNLVLNIMFTALPRTAAAQAYRGFLGLDIAKLEGLRAIENEPQDYDDKGVQADACKVCHATLDPASYPFKNYQGLTGSVGSYDPTRIEDDFRNEGPRIEQMPEAGFVLGQPVSDLVEWAQVAANSDDFKRNISQMLFEAVLQRSPGPGDSTDFAGLWQGLEGDDYSANRMLHRLVDTEAFGRP